MDSTVRRMTRPSARGAAMIGACAIAAGAAVGACAKDDEATDGGGATATATTTGGAGGSGGGATTTTGSTTSTGSTSTTTSTSSGACGGGCADGLVCCDDPSSGAPACVDPQTNRFHCGACGTVCQGADYCVAGACVTPADGGACDPPPTCSPPCQGGAVCSVDPGTCKAACCAPPNVFCGGACVLPSDNANCGACGKACSDDTACGSEGGAIACLPVTCGPGADVCHHGCVDVQSDPANCGACGKACAPDTACGAGVCCAPFAALSPTVLKAGLAGGAGAIGLGGGFVLYRELASLLGVPTKGGAVTVVADPDDDPKIGTSGAFGATPTTVYWSNIEGRAFQKPFGGAATKIIDDKTLVSVSRVAADAAGVYYASLFEQAIWRPAKSAAECPDPAVPQCAVVVVKAAAPVSAIALTADHVYFAAKSIYRVARTGNPVPALLVDSSVVDGDATRLAIAGDSIVWASTKVEKSHTAVGAAKLDGTGARVLWRAGDDVPIDVTGLAADASWVFFSATGADAAVRRVPVAGGCPDLLVKLTKSGDLVADATRLYFVDQAASAALDAVTKP